MPASWFHNPSFIQRAPIVRALCLAAAPFCLAFMPMLTESTSAQPPKFVPNYDEAKVPKYELPAMWKSAPPADPKAAAEAWHVRRIELLDMLTHQMFGTMPNKQAKLEWKTIEQGTAFDGSVKRKQIRVTLSTEAGSLPIDLLVYTPASANGPVTTFLGLNFQGNHTTTPDTAVIIPSSWVPDNKNGTTDKNKALEAGRNAQGHRMPVEMITKAGFGIATAYYGDIDPDFDDEFKNGIHALFPEHKPDEAHPDSWGSIAAWAWALSRLLDVLQVQPEIDAKSVIVFGHSRLGKTSLWAGATDTRFAGVISNDSGCGGAALSRRAYGETVWRINNSFPHWFCRNYRQYNNNEGAAPFDQHQLLALAAPRLLHVASASEDQWADPRGEFLSTLEAGHVYEALGLPGLGLREFPEPGVSSIGWVSYHYRVGKHDLNEWDWQQYVKSAALLKKAN
ncbi:MAG: acetylxylan esterase [Pirellulales bacterium]